MAWPEQVLSTQTHLDAGSVQPTANVNWENVTPDVIDECVDVGDTLDLGGPESLGTVCVGVDNPTEIVSKVFDVVLGCADHNNTATFTTNDTGASGYDCAKVTVCGYILPTADKTAVGSFDRTYTWTIDKAVDKTKVSGEVGGTATFNYTVTVQHDAGTDGNGAVSGTIHVTNGNGVDVTVDVQRLVPGRRLHDRWWWRRPGDSRRRKVLRLHLRPPLDPRTGTDTNTATVHLVGADPRQRRRASRPGRRLGRKGTSIGARCNPTLIDDCVDVHRRCRSNAARQHVLGKVCVGDANPTEFKFSVGFPS